MEDELQDGGQATATVDWQSDPDFHALPMPEKHKALLELDSDYKALPGDEQVKALNTIHYGDAPTEPKGAFSRFMSGFLPSWESAKSAMSSLIPHPAGEMTHMDERTGRIDNVPELEPNYRYQDARIKYQNQPNDPRSNPTYAPAAGLSAFVPGLNPESMERRADTGDTAGVAGEAAFPLAVLGATEGAGKFGEGVEAATNKYQAWKEPRRINSARENLVKSLDTPPGKRGERAAKMKEDVHAATADLAAIEKDTPSKVTFMLKRGKGADSFHELAEKIDARQDEMWEKGHSPGIERHAEAPIDHDAIRRAGEKVLANREAVENAPAEATAAKAWLDSVAKERGLKSADNLIREVNTDMRGKASANQPYSELQTRIRKEVVSELRNQVETVLDKSGEKGVKEVNRRWGALDNIKGRLIERAVQEARTEAKVGPLPQWAQVYTFLHPEAFGIAVGLKAAKALKPNQSSRLTGAMRDLGRTSLEAPYEAAPPEGWGTPPKGLLPPPAEQLPINRTAPDDSSVLAVDPATNVQRGNSGRMQRVYEGSAKPRVVGQTADGGPIYEDVPPAERAEQAISHEPIAKVRATRGAKDKGVKGGAPERRSSIRDVQGPDLMRTARAQQLRSLLQDPTLPDADRAIIEAQLEDLKAHPFERHEGGDINSMKAKKTVSREEAEQTTEKRKEGRKKRFQGAG